MVDLTYAIQAKQIVKAFGGVRALDGTDIAVAPGSVHALIGPNGSGKTTLLHIICGSLRADSGSVVINATDVTKFPAWRRARLGLGRAFQTPALFESMTVRESLDVAGIAGVRAHRKSRAQTNFGGGRRVEWATEVGHLGDILSVPVSGLSHGDRKRLEVALALAAGCELLALDEPTAGMSAAETADLSDLVSKVVKEWSVTILLVEHDMDVVFGVADTVTVLDRGAVLCEGPPEVIRRDSAVRDVYLG